MAVLEQFLKPIEGNVASPRFGFSPNLKLLVAMIVTPFCMNTLQFLVTDNFIKKKGTVAPLLFVCSSRTPKHDVFMILHVSSLNENV